MAQIPKEIKNTLIEKKVKKKILMWSHWWYNVFKLNNYKAHYTWCKTTEEVTGMDDASFRTKIEPHYLRIETWANLPYAVELWDEGKLKEIEQDIVHELVHAVISPMSHLVKMLDTAKTQEEWHKVTEENICESLARSFMEVYDAGLEQGIKDAKNGTH